MMKQKFALHVHHSLIAIEQLTEPIENRISYIRMYKPEGEVEMRLRLLRELTEEEVDQLPQGWREACRVLGESRLSWRDAEVWLEACRVYAPQLEALHTRICLPDCPWDGYTIFPRR